MLPDEQTAPEQHEGFRRMTPEWRLALGGTTLLDRPGTQGRVVAATAYGVDFVVFLRGEGNPAAGRGEG